MMDLTGLKALTIPEGAVHKIHAAGQLLWEKFKNWVPFSINSDGTIYNTTGYKTGYRIRSGGAEAAYTLAVCTGFIPLSIGDTLRIYPAFTGKNGENAVNFADENFSNIGQTTASGANYGICQEVRYTLQNVDGVTQLTLTASHDSSIRYVRVSNATTTTNGADMIITINQDIF